MCSTTPSAQVTLPAQLASARLARRFVDEHWCTAHGDDDHGRVHLLVSELVSNAVRHGGPPITFVMNCVGAEGVLVSVSDGSDDVPSLRRPEPAALGGRGVQLVDLLSEEWGIEHHHDKHHRGDEHTDSASPGKGKTVWCRLVA